MNSPQSTTCLYCETNFQWTPRDKYDRWPPQRCPACAAIAIKRNYHEAIEKANIAIIEKTPIRFRQTDAGHPEFNLRLWQRIQSWRPSEERPWLGMVGPTGTSKTRCGILLLREVIKDMIRPSSDPDRKPCAPSFLIMPAYRFGEAVAAKGTDAKADAIGFLDGLRRVGVLLIDDLGKQRNTPAVSAELFALADHRHCQNLCTIWTANTSPEGITVGMGEDIAVPLAGRIRECSLIINVS